MAFDIRSALTVCVAVSVGSLSVFAQPAADKPNPHAKIPASGFAVIHVNVDQLYRSDVFRPIREQADRMREELKLNGGMPTAFATDTVERASFFWISPPQDFTLDALRIPYQLNTSKKPLDVKKMLADLETVSLREMARTRPKDDKPTAGTIDPDGIYHSEKTKRLFMVIDDRTVLFLPERYGYLDGLLNMTKLYQSRNDGPLAEAHALAGRHSVVVGINPPLLVEGLSPLEAKRVTETYPFVTATKVTATADIGDPIRVSVSASFASDDDAKKAEAALAGWVQKGVAQLKEWRTEFAADPTAKDVVPPLIDAGLIALEKMTVKRTGAEITVRADIPVSEDTRKALGRFPDWGKAYADEQITINNMRQLALAAENHTDAFGRMPRDITDEDGKPLLSWRVELLPYLERDDLYRKIDRTKAWDDPANKPLWEQMPKQFVIRTRPAKEKGQTYFLAPRADKWTGKGDPWLVPGKKITEADLKAWDGPANTVFVIEAESPVNWMKPADLEFDPKTLPKVGDPKANGVFVAFWGDSARRMNRGDLGDDALRAILTVNGGEKVPAARK